MTIELKFKDLVDFYRKVLEHFPDKRTGKNKKYKIAEIALGAFSVFFMQSSSFLAHQREMEVREGCNNACSLFNISKIPSDNHIRDILDEVSPNAVFPVFDYIFEALDATNHLSKFRFLQNQFLILLDGTEYFSSNKINCNKCFKREHINGEITYSHTAITPVIAHPDFRQVITLPPEFITPQDGHEKQDCENAAAKRWMKGLGAKYADLGTTIIADDLYSKSTLCQIALKQKFNFIFVCKSTSHKTIYKDYINSGIKLERTSIRRRNSKGKMDAMEYRFINEISLCDEDTTLNVNWCEVSIVDDKGKSTYKNAFITNHHITENNVADIVLAGRTRWKVENENNNTLKTKGYHLENNYGHGNNHLSKLLLT